MIDEQLFLAPVGVVGHRAALRQLEHAARHVGEIAAYELEGVLLALGLVVDHARDARVHLRAAELLLVDLVAHAGAPDHGRAAGEYLARALHHDGEVRAAGLERAESGARTEGHCDHRDVAEQADHRPGRIARDLGAALLLDQTHAAAGALAQADERQAVLERVVLRVDPFLRDGRLRRAAADRVVVDVERDLAPVDARGADDGVRRPHVEEVAVLVVLALASHHADLEPRPGIDQPVDALARGEASGLVLAANTLLPAQPVRELLPALDLVDFGLPAHGQRV